MKIKLIHITSTIKIMYLVLLVLSQGSEQDVVGRNKPDLYSLVTSAQSTPVRVRITRSPQLDLTANSEYSYPLYYEKYLKKHSQNQEKDESKYPITDDLPEYPNTPHPIEQLEEISAITNDRLESSTSAAKNLQVIMNTGHLGYPVDDEILEKLGLG